MSLAGKIKIIGSDIVKHEISKTPDPVRKSQLLSLSNYISKNYSLSDGMIELAHELQKNGFGAFDALHIAVSEKCGVDVFITTDDKILKLYQRKSDLINIRIDNPVNILRELLL
jgi:predicted nucleic acid-binding protein